jgi:DNA-directed RNA polymerase specialized sigma24 family protein
MPRDAQHELPSDGTALACLAADIGQLQEVRERAWERLFPVIEGIARQVASRFRGSLHDELAAESAAIIWMRIQRFQPECGRFEDWCRTVLYHDAIDVWRSRKLSPVPPAAGGEGPNLALEAAARQLTQGELSRDASWRAELSQHIQWLLPWHPGEQQAGLKRDWPPLQTVWKAISTAIGNPAVKIEAELICRTIAPLLPPGTQLTPDVWNQWVRRAKDQARTQVQDEPVWARCFSRLLPDYQRGGPS